MTKKQKSVLTRKNKNYTSIFITDFSDETLEEAVNLKDAIPLSVIKLKKSAVEDYIRRYSPMEKIEKAKHSEVGYQFEIAGFYFTRIEDMQGCYITLRDETDYKNERACCEFGTFGQNDILIDIIFEHKTGRIRY
ncbi:MAG: hypothetical protein QP871_10205 [Lactobacillus crispatus]|uniref:hypothetical protein n=2 Tax=Bacilli TaxID=91061 RepID=UPI00254D5091|nr:MULTISPECIES: hypothetical protein [Bacilli]MDK7284469.1 hypothetical protein [Staphylococcus pettenkoferi]MDK8509793.1 hypothetical protein [Lactobacillus crispatus]